MKQKGGSRKPPDNLVFLLCLQVHLDGQAKDKIVEDGNEPKGDFSSFYCYILLLPNQS